MILTGVHPQGSLGVVHLITTRRTPQNSIDIHDLKDVDVTKRIDRWGFEGPCRACRKWTRRLSSVDDLGCVDRDIRGTAAAV
jgi:hypothetical protein